MGHFTTIFAPKLNVLFQFAVRMPSISKTDHCVDRSTLALLSAYQEYLVTFKLMWSQVVQRARPLRTCIYVLGGQRVNVISVLERFELDRVVQVGTESLYIQKRALHKLEGVDAYIPMLSNGEIWKEIFEVLFEGKETSQKDVGLARWHHRGEWLYLPNQRAEYYSKPEHIKQAKPLIQSTRLHYDDPLTRHQLSYLNGP